MKLKNPIVVSASPLTEKLENFARLEDAGASAIVMYSLMEEQIEAESENIDNALEYGANSYAESTSYLPDMQKYHIGPDRYLELLHKGKKSVSIPVIASLNGRSPGGWVRYAEYMEQAGADALELNIFDVPTDPDADGGRAGDALLQPRARDSQERSNPDRGEARSLFHFVRELRQEALPKRAPTAWSSSTASISPTSTWRRWRSHRTWC